MSSWSGDLLCSRINDLELARRSHIKKDSIKESGYEGGLSVRQRIDLYASEYSVLYLLL